MKKAIIDVETTGFSSSNDRIIEVGIVTFNDDGIIDEYGQLINPGIPIPPKITEINGITNDVISECLDFVVYAQNIMEFLEGSEEIIAHNASFDQRFFNAEFARLQIPVNIKFGCTMKAARKAWPELKSHSLPNLCNRFNIDQGNAHRALDDAKATYEVYKILSK